MTDALSRFEALPLEGALVSNIKIIPQKKVHLTITCFSNHPAKVTDGSQYELVFVKVLGFDFQSSDVVYKITSSSILNDSLLLKKSKDNIRKTGTKFTKTHFNHYHIEFEAGYLDIVAEGFCCILFWEPEKG